MNLYSKSKKPQNPGFGDIHPTAPAISEFELSCGDSYVTLTCVKCNVPFRGPLTQAKNNMRKHWKRVHLQIREYSCEKCGKKFAGSWELQRHSKVHNRS